jgi:hypothetical protein
MVSQMCSFFLTGLPKAVTVEKQSTLPPINKEAVSGEK